MYMCLLYIYIEDIIHVLYIYSIYVLVWLSRDQKKLKLGFIPNRNGLNAEGVFAEFELQPFSPTKKKEFQPL